MRLSDEIELDGPPAYEMGDRVRVTIEGIGSLENTVEPRLQPDDDETVDQSQADPLPEL